MTMNPPCQQGYESLIAVSKPQFMRQLLSDLLWHLQDKFNLAPNYFFPGSGRKEIKSPYDFKVGERIRVKSFEQIKSTLDDQGKYDGLCFMPEMKAFCGEEHVIFKRVDRILLESTGRLRCLHGVVILQDLVCSGSMHYKCDRTCFFFWKQIWLERAEKGGETDEKAGKSQVPSRC